MFDLDALVDETKETPFVFKFGGREFSVPSRENADYEILNKLEDNDFKGAFKLLVGDALWPEFNKNVLRLKQVKALLGAWSAFKGDAEGESSDSSAS